MGLSEMQDFIEAIIEGDNSRVLSELRGLIELKVKPERIIKDGIEAAVNYLNDKCSIDSFNLLEIMLVGRAIMSIINELFPQGLPPSQAKATVVIGTIEGDIHDFGKNIVKMILKAKGYRVIDCGKDCPIEQLIYNVQVNSASALLISGLITSIIPKVQKLKDLLEKRGLTNIKLIAGGAALKMASPEYLNVDYVAETVFDGVNYLEKLQEV